MAKSLKGYKSCKIGAVAGDGGMGSSLTAIGSTVKGSVVANTTEAGMKDFNIEETSAPFESAVTADPNLEGTLEIYDVDPDTVVKIFGGTVTSSGTGPTKRKVYTPPAVYTPIENSMELESKNGAILAVVRAQFLPIWNLFFQDEELGKIVLNWKALAPTKAATAPYTFSTPDPAA